MVSRAWIECFIPLLIASLLLNIAGFLSALKGRACPLLPFFLRVSAPCLICHVIVRQAAHATCSMNASGWPLVFLGQDLLPTLPQHSVLGEKTKIFSCWIFLEEAAFLKTKLLQHDWKLFCPLYVT